MKIDASRDEVRLAGILEALTGRWRFAEPAPAGESGTALVSVEETNEALVLGGRKLQDFAAVQAENPRILDLEELPSSPAIDPSRIAVILLCGGMSSRSGGRIHPLLRVEDPKGGSSTLLDLKLGALSRSPLAAARRLVVGSLFNEAQLREHLRGRQTTRQVSLYVTGLGPFLRQHQRCSGPPRIFRDRAGEPVFTSAGHLDALRWLVGSGTLADLQEVEVLLVVSYSNWGRLFTRETISLASRAAEHGRRGDPILFVVEVTARPRQKKTGSLLVEGPEDLAGFRLVKYSYGGDAPLYPAGGQVLMSTNTLYVSVENLRASLLEACPEIGLRARPEELQTLLVDAGRHRRRREACALFDAAFPARPVLVRKTLDGSPVLHAERLLDQLALLPGSPRFEPVRVPEERGMSIKLPEDLEDPRKRACLFR